MEASSVSGGRLCALCCVVLHPVIFCVIFLLLFNDTMELAVKPGVGLGRCRCYDRPRIEGLEGFGFEAQQAHMYMYKMYKTENTPRLNVKIFPISAILHLWSLSGQNPVKLKLKAAPPSGHLGHSPSTPNLRRNVQSLDQVRTHRANSSKAYAMDCSLAHLG
jgi:hypothetical protein